MKKNILHPLLIFLLLVALLCGAWGSTAKAWTTFTHGNLTIRIASEGNTLDGYRCIGFDPASIRELENAVRYFSQFVGSTSTVQVGFAPISGNGYAYIGGATGGGI